MPNPQSTAVAVEFLKTAAGLVAGGRAEDYGDPLICHEKMAVLVNAYMQIRRDPNAPLTPADIAAIELLFKLARSQVGRFKEDTFCDGAAYFALTGAFDWIYRSVAGDLDKPQENTDERQRV